MNLFIAGLPLHTSAVDLQLLLALLDPDQIEPHVPPTQGTFAFLKVPQRQVEYACKMYDGLEYCKKLIHVSAVRTAVGCRKCMKFGHSDDDCDSFPLSYRKSLLVEPPDNTTPQVDSIVFAREWEEDDASDEWPYREREAEVHIPRPEDAYRTPPAKRLRARSTPLSAISQPSFRSLSQTSKKAARRLVSALRAEQSAVFSGCHFRLVRSGKKPASVSSRVVCGVCKNSIMVRNVPKHISSLSHQKASQFAVDCNGDYS